MEKPCLLGLDSLFGNAACDDLGRMQRQVRGEIVPLILEGGVEQVESLVTSSDVEDERLKLHCRVVRGEAADATEEACGGQAAVSSCSGEVEGGAMKVESGRTVPSSGTAANMSTRCLGGRRKVREEQPCKEEFLLEIPAIEDLM